MALPLRKAGEFTYADYLRFPENERWELIDGAAWSMSPAPGRRHQRIVLRAARKIAEVMDDGPCEPYIAPFDVRFTDNTAEEIDTVVQPDISVFCDPAVLDDRGAHGAPDLVVEVLSESTSHKDQTEKLALFERHRVREYWIINGDTPPWVMVFRIGDDGRYQKPDYYRIDETIRSDVLGAAFRVRDFIPE